MPDDEIERIFPPAAGDGPLSDEQLLELYSPGGSTRPMVRANFVSSIDGSATAFGLSGRLGAPADKRVFDLLRRLCDVILVGAGTVRAEGYGAMRLGHDAESWRLAHGLAAQPAFAIVTRSLRLDPSSAVFADAPVRPLVLTGASADPERRASLSAVAEILDCGETTVDMGTMVERLAARGLTRIHCEGGPSLLGDLVSADVLDELCLTISPSLEGGAGARISRATSPMELRRMTLDHVLLSGSMMLTRYSRRRG
ncbi:MAG TPA: pyrimidine reductase family protein [Lacisediminihabitans sp.]|uniref:pyrimidine reductase family protein n=1 Tax=Lacisediminihabitans sp. TaxID=2787631 RepID=UPI002ED961C5